MPNKSMNKQVVGLFGKYGSNRVKVPLFQVKALLESYGARVLLGDSTSADLVDVQMLATESDYEKLDFAVVVGGDGTLLHAARTLAPYEVPIVGVNLGRLGFLTDIPASEIEQGLQAIKDGAYYIEQRTMLQTHLLDDNNEAMGTDYLSLNDTVISKGESGRLIEVEIKVNGVFVSRTRSDGMIISTPTGSTAYALSSGGPIVEPSLHVITIVPICPHMLSHRPIIINQHSIVDITLIDLEDDQATLATDGINCMRLDSNARIRIQNSDVELSLMRMQNHNHFEALRSKLGWSN